MDKRVVVTGMGVVSSVGCNVEKFWDSLVNGVSGITKITYFPSDDLPSKVAGEIHDFDLEEQGIDKPFARRQDKFTIYAVAAANQAMKQSGLCAKASEGAEPNIDPFRLGVYVGSGIGGWNTQAVEYKKLFSEGPRWISPTFAATMIPNIAGGNIAIRFGACGPALPVTAACATSTIAIGEAYRAIKHGYVDAIIAGGAEATVTPMSVAAFGNSKALTKVEDPSRACLPFSADRSGFVLADGAAVLVLEEYDHAKARGAEILAEVVGYGHTNDAYHVTAPNPTGETQARAFSDCLKEAGYTDADEVHINAHGTGTVLNDTCETKMIKVAMGDAAYRAHICSTKSMTGHPLGAAGAIEAVASVLALRSGIVPPTIGLDNPDPECDLDYTPNKAKKADLTLAVSNSLGFGGHNCAVAFRKVK